MVSVTNRNVLQLSGSTMDKIISLDSSNDIQQNEIVVALDTKQLVISNKDNVLSPVYTGLESMKSVVEPEVGNKSFYYETDTKKLNFKYNNQFNSIKFDFIHTANNIPYTNENAEIAFNGVNCKEGLDELFERYRKIKIDIEDTLSDFLPFKEFEVDSDYLSNQSLSINSTVHSNGDVMIMYNRNLFGYASSMFMISYDNGRTVEPITNLTPLVGDTINAAINYFNNTWYIACITRDLHDPEPFKYGIKVLSSSDGLNWSEIYNVDPNSSYLNDVTNNVIEFGGLYTRLSSPCKIIQYHSSFYMPGWFTDYTNYVSYKLKYTSDFIDYTEKTISTGSHVYGNLLKVCNDKLFFVYYESIYPGLSGGSYLGYTTNEDLSGMKKTSKITNGTLTNIEYIDGMYLVTETTGSRISYSTDLLSWSYLHLSSKNRLRYIYRINDKLYGLIFDKNDNKIDNKIVKINGTFPSWSYEDFITLKTDIIYYVEQIPDGLFIAYKDETPQYIKIN